MDKTEWIKNQLKESYPNSWYFLADTLLIVAGISIVVLFHWAAYRQWWLFLSAGIILSFCGYRWLLLSAQNAPFKKIATDKTFAFHINFILIIGNLLLVVMGLGLALWGIRVTAGGNIMTSPDLSRLDAWTNGYFNLVWVFAGLFIGAFILLVIHVWLLAGKSKKENVNSDIGAVNKQMADELKRIKDKQNSKE